MSKKDKLAVYLTPEKKTELERRYHEDGSRSMTAFIEHALDFYLDYALTQQREARPEPDGEVRQKIMEQNLAHIEWVVRGYRDGLLRFCSRFREEKEVWKAEITEEQLQAVLRAYNEQLEDFSRRAAQYSLGEFLGEELKISGV